MRGAAVAAGLLLAVLAFALAFMPRRVAATSAIVAVMVAIGASAISGTDVEIAFAGCWIGLIATALFVYWPRLVRDSAGTAGPLLATNAGLWAGLVVSTEATTTTLVMVLPVLLLIIPAAWANARGWTIAPRVVTSWLLAVALLVGAIPHLVVHPGYEPDHQL